MCKDGCMWVKECECVLGGNMRRWMFVCGYIGSRARLCRKVCIGTSVTFIPVNIRGGKSFFFIIFNDFFSVKMITERSDGF